MDTLHFIQENTFLLGCILATGGASLKLYIDYLDLKKRMELLEERFIKLEEEKIVRIEEGMSTLLENQHKQALMLSSIDERTQYTVKGMNRIEEVLSRKIK